MPPVDHATARALAEAAVIEPDPYWPDRPRVMIDDRYTIEREYGWVFFQYVPSAIVAGNAPVLVTRADGVVWSLGTAEPVDAYLARFERSGDPHREAAI